MPDKDIRQTEGVVISEELMERLQALPDAHAGAARTEFTLEEDEALVQYWMVKRKADVAKAIGHCLNACRERYNELVEGK